MPLIARIILCGALVQVLGIASGLTASKGISGWFKSLIEPSFAPPAWVFGPVWALLYFLIGVSLALIIHRTSGRQRRLLLSAFAVQMVLNLAWTPVFFGLHNITAALVVIGLLALAIVVLIALCWRSVRLASYLLLPYLAWVVFATVLNAAYYRLNVSGVGELVSQF